MTWLALDIGGANLKASDGIRYAATQSFALWRHPEQLPAAIRQLVASAPSFRRTAVTMTGELADCFAHRDEGVQAILSAVREALPASAIYVYQTDGQLLPLDNPCRQTSLAAASNWHALATYACRWTDGLPAMLIDVGSTTVDLIPMVHCRVAARGATDVDRLIHGELFYTGVERSPVCAVAAALPYRGDNVPTAHELFATTLDAYLVLGAIAEDPANCATADARPRTIDAARRRLGRAICTEVSEGEARLIAQAIADAQVRMIRESWGKAAAALPDPPRRVVVSGHGDYLVDRVVATFGGPCEVIRLTDRIGVEASRVAPAFALAVLAKERGDR